MKFLIIPVLAVFLAHPLKANENLSISQFVSKIPLWEVYPNSKPNVIGDGGKAFGYYQITSIMVKDFNRISGEKLSHEDCFDPTISKEIAYTVLSHYSAYIKKTRDRADCKALVVYMEWWWWCLETSTYSYQ